MCICTPVYTHTRTCEHMQNCTPHTCNYERKQHFQWSVWIVYHNKKNFKVKELLTDALTWMNPEGTTLSKMRQTQQENLCAYSNGKWLWLGIQMVSAQAQNEVGGVQVCITQEAEAGGSWVQGQLGVHSKTLSQKQQNVQWVHLFEKMKRLENGWWCWI